MNAVSTRPAMNVAATLSVLGFALSLLLPALFPSETIAYAMPLAAVAALWMVPLAAGLVRGEKWAFVLGIALVIFLTDSSFRARDWSDKSVDWQILMKGAAWAGAGLIGLVRLNRTGALLTTAPGGLAAAFVALLAVSALWSDSPLYTLASAAAYGWLLLFALAAAQVLDEDGLLAALALGCGLIVLPSLAVSPFATGVAEVTDFATGEAHRLRGITNHPIPLAESAALFTFACGALAVRSRGFARKALFVALVAAGIWVIWLTRSRVPPLAMAAALVGVLAYRRGRGPLLLAAMVAAGAAMLIIEATGGVMEMLPGDLLAVMSRSRSPDEILTISGRLEIWPYALELIGQAPFLGHGHASGMELFKGFTQWHITHAHNAYLQILLYTGIAGAALAGGVLVAQYRVMAAGPLLVRDTLFLYTLLKGLTEQSIMANMPSSSVLVWMLTIGLAAVARVQSRR